MSEGDELKTLYGILGFGRAGHATDLGHSTATDSTTSYYRTSGKYVGYARRMSGAIRLYLPGGREVAAYRE